MFQKLNDIIKDVIINHKNNRTSIFISTGYKLLDYVLGGLEIGTNVIIGARPGIGKSAFALNLLLNIFENNKDRNIVCYYHNLEMSNKQIGYRYIASIIGEDIITTKKKEFSQQDLSLIKDFYNRISLYEIYFNDNDNSIDEIKRFILSNNGDNIIVNIIDHSRLVSSIERANEEQRLFHLYKELNIIKKYNCINIILSQLNREYDKHTENGKYSNPSSSYLFGSDAAQQFADVTILLHQPKKSGIHSWEYYMNGSTLQLNTDNILSLYIDKNRNGITNVNIPLHYDLVKQKIFDYKLNNGY